MSEQMASPSGEKRFEDVPKVVEQGHSRRSFLGRLSALAVGTLATTGVSRTANADVPIIETNPQGYLERRRELAYKLRLKVADLVRKQPLIARNGNGDEELYPTRIASFTKCLPHNDLGEVDPAAYNALLQALRTGDQNDFFAIPMGGNLLFHSPQAAFAFSLEGLDTWQCGMPSAPRFASAEKASEMAELYWMALARDIPFSDYDSHLAIAAAAADLSTFSDFRGPKQSGQVTPATLFRASFPGVLTGPYISQYLLRPFNAGVNFTSQKNRFPATGSNFGWDYATWLALQRGNVLSSPPALDPEPRYLRCLRDLAEWVHADYPSLAATHAGLILASLGPDYVFAGNPYQSMGTEMGFATFGHADLLACVNSAANDAIRTAWYQKWLIHRHLRPEEFAGRVHVTLTQEHEPPFNPEILTSQALEQTFAAQGTYLLSQAYPEGCPPHSAYPSGHASFVGASVTILKAYFREDAVLPNPVVPSPDGSELLPYSGPALTVGGELNKLAMNVAMGRIAAGVHWRCDAVEGMLLGEAVAIALLRDRRGCYKEVFPGFTITKFDGTQVTI